MEWWNEGCHSVGIMTLDPDGSLHSTLAKMCIYGGICANMAEYVQKIVKKGKTRCKFGGTGWYRSLCFIYIFAPKFEGFDYKVVRWYRILQVQRVVSLVCVMTLDGFLGWCHLFAS